MRDTTETGRLRHRADWQLPTQVQDRLGRDVRAANKYETERQIWCDVRELSGNESEYQRQLTAEDTHTVRVRFKSDYSRSGRFLFRGRALYVRDIVDGDETRRELILVCGSTPR